jgi:hypothetical protein
MKFHYVCVVLALIVLPPLPFLDGHATAFGQCSSGSCGVSSGGGYAGFSPFGGYRSSILPPMTTYAPYTSPTYDYPSGSVPCGTTAVYSTPAPRSYSLKDSDGQSWVHTNPTYLRAWVAGRNAALASASAKVVVRTKAVTCSCSGEACVCTVPGECGRPGCRAVASIPPVPPFP